jgi:hypothetical protein
MFKPGKIDPQVGIDCLQWVLSQQRGGEMGVIQVDRENCKILWHALRGGWHRPVARTGIVGSKPVKNEHSHPGDAARYGASLLFPQGRLQKRGVGLVHVDTPRYFGKRTLGFERPGAQVPEHGDTIGPPAEPTGR